MWYYRLDRLRDADGRELWDINTKTIESVHDAIINDKQIQQQIEKIRGHEWVKLVEGEEK